jgi:hypothetical protein
MNNKLVYAFMICWIWPLTVYAESFFSESFQYDGTALPEYVNKITTDYFKDSSEPVQQRLQQYYGFSELLQQPHDSSQQATWYFIQGLNDLNIISILQQIQTESNIDNQAEIDKFDQLVQQAFKKAMAADKKSQELSPNMYATMQRALSGNLKIQALQKELSLGGSGESEASYWFKHWQVIGALKDAGRYQEAEQAIRTMQGELEQAGLQNSAYNQIPERAVQELSRERKQSQTKTVSQGKKSLNKPQSTVEKLIRKYWPLFLINGLMLVFIVIAAFLRFRNKS